MKQLVKILAMATWITMLTTSCVKDIITEVNMSQPDYIHFNSTTTRAAVVDLTALQSDVNGFQVYAKGGSNPSGWYTDTDFNRIDGLNPYRFTFDRWDFNKPVKWPSDAAHYPMAFHAFHPALLEGLSSTDELAVETNFGVVYTIQEEGRQVDLLSARSLVGAKPATGKVTLSFQHALSRVNFGIITGKGVMPVIQSLQLVNIVDTKIYDFASNEWVTIPMDTPYNADYYYYGAPDGHVIPPFTPAIADEHTANPVYTGAHDKHLILMPQTTASWKPQSGMSPDASSGGYISLIYRMSTGNGTNGVGNVREVGFDDATLHPDYSASGGGVTGPLYVKAGFPLPATSGNFTWDQGHSYLYNIVLGAHGSCNGYILDDYYYDAKGDRTNLRLIEVRDEGKQTGDKLQDGTIHVRLEVDNWNNQDGGDLTPRSITVTQKNFMLNHQEQKPAKQNITVKCTLGESPDPSACWTLSVPANQSWLRLSLDPNATFNTASASLNDITGSRTVYIYTTANTSSEMRTATFSLNGKTAGNILQDRNVLDKPDDFIYSSGAIRYVGAFWRAGEMGERLINARNIANNVGKWYASVIWADDRWDDGDIVLALGGSPQLSSSAEAAINRVIGDDTMVEGEVKTGNEAIAFRIGLKSTYKPTAAYPARYAVVALIYNNGKSVQKIFLRQGEGDDYVMRPTDPINVAGYISPDRPAARKFSPYNLTAKEVKTGSSVSDHTQLTVVSGNTGGGVFVKYPTHAGALFQWAMHGIPRMAYHPVAPTGSISLYPATTLHDFGPDKWAPSTNETCPPGYRRPNDVNTSITHNTKGPITGSEIRQSLWINPPTGNDANTNATANNSMFGCYADGYYDRRPVVESITKAPYSTVEPKSVDVAYRGRLFYNPETNASIFLPVSGFRNEKNGQLEMTGNIGHYWTSSSVNYQQALHLRITSSDYKNQANMSIAYRNTAGVIRCIKAE